MSSSYQQNLSRYLTSSNSGTLLTNNLSALNVVSFENPITRTKHTIPLKDATTNAASLATNVYNAQSNVQQMLSGNGIIDYYVPLNSIQGKVFDIFISFKISNNTGGPVELAPVPGWFSRVEILLGTNPVQVLYPEDLFFYYWVLEQSEFVSISDLLNLDDRFLPRRDVIANGDLREYLLLMPVNFIRQAGLVGEGLSQQLNIRLFMATPNEILVSGLAPTVYDSRLQIITNQLLTDTLRDAAMKQVIGNYRTRYFWNVRQLENLSGVLPSTQYNINMTSFNGMFNLCQFSITAQNAQNLARYTTYPVLDWDILDSNGNSVLNNAARQTDEESQYWDSAIINPFSNFFDTMSVYIMPFSTTVKNDLLTGTINGLFFIDGRFRLSFTTGTIRIPKVVTISLSGVGPAGPAASGAFRLTYGSGVSGINETTPYIAWNSTAAQIKAAIEALPTFMKFSQTVTVSGPLTAQPITISYDISGNLAYDEWDDNADFILQSAVLNAGGDTLIYNSPITQQPQDGWPGNPFDITVNMQGCQMSAIEINQQGAINLFKG